MIAGLEQPTSGQVLLGEQDIAGLRPYKRPVNTVFQSYALFPHLDIHENVAFGLRRRGIRKVSDQVERDARAGRSSKGTADAARPSSPAASSSASRWPGRSSTTRRCCCSTSRSARST